MENKRTFNVASIIFLCCLIYAIIRYNIFKQVDFIHLPLYIINKAVSWSSVSILLFIFVSKYLHSLGKNSWTRWVEIDGRLHAVLFYMVLLHIILSLLLLSPEYYQKFFLSGGKLNLYGELSMLTGALSFVIIYSYYHGNLKSLLSSTRFINMVLLVLIFFHLFFMGVKGWINISKWPGGLPPITLLAAFKIFIVMLISSRAFIRKN